MLKKGDKVIPVSKNIGCPPEKSITWTKGREQGFLYVTKLLNYDDDNEPNMVVCSNEQEDIAIEDGDFYLESDLVPYEEVEFLMDRFKKLKDKKLRETEEELEKIKKAILVFLQA